MKKPFEYDHTNGDFERPSGGLENLEDDFTMASQQNHKETWQNSIEDSYFDFDGENLDTDVYYDGMLIILFLILL